MKKWAKKLLAVVLSACMVSAVVPTALASGSFNANATTNGTSSIYIEWETVTGANAYNVWRSMNSNGPFSEIYNISNTDFTDTGLAPGTTYYYKIEALDDGTTISESNITSAQTDDLAPLNPTATALDAHRIQVGWDDVGAYQYTIYRSTYDGGYTYLTSVADISYTDSGLTENALYWYRIVASNGAEGVVSANTFSLPGVPQNVVARGISMSEVQVSWDASENTEGYTLYRSESQNGTYLPIDTVDFPATSYTDTGLNPSTTYWYKIKAISSVGSSDFSNTAAGTTLAPPTPARVQAAAQSSSAIAVTWDGVAGAESYRVYRSTAADGSYELAGTTTDTDLTDSGLSAATTYYYKVTAVASGVESDKAGPASDTTWAEAPANISAQAVDTSRIQINWTSVTEAESYNLYRSNSENGTYTQIANTTVPEYVDSGLAASTTYWYKVSAVTNELESTQTGPASATTLTPAPDPDPDADPEITLYISKVLKDAEGNLVGTGKVFYAQVVDSQMRVVATVEVKANSEPTEVAGLKSGEVYGIAEMTGQHFSFEGFDVSGNRIQKEYIVFRSTLSSNEVEGKISITLNNQCEEEDLDKEDPPKAIEWPDDFDGEDIIDIFPEEIPLSAGNSTDDSTNDSAGDGAGTATPSTGEINIWYVLSPLAVSALLLAGITLVRRKQQNK